MQARHARLIRRGIKAAHVMFPYIPKVVELEKEDPVLAASYWKTGLGMKWVFFTEFTELSTKAFDRTIYKEKERYESRNYPR